jgi:Ca2+-binding EF-hand superfamily protein
MIPLRQNRSAIALFMMLGTTLSGVALAQAPSPQKIEEKFKAADVNHDGKLTLEEAKAGMPRVAKAFDKIDVEKRGYITLEQLQAFADKH